MGWDDETHDSDLLSQRDGLSSALDAQAQAGRVVQETASLYAPPWAYRSAQMPVWVATGLQAGAGMNKIVSFKPTAPAPAFHQSQIESAVDDLRQVDALLARQCATKRYFQRGWQKCNLCGVYGRYMVMVRWFRSHLAEHKIYRELGLEDTWMRENCQRQADGQARAHRNSLLRRQQKTLIRNEFAQTDDLRAFLRRRTRWSPMDAKRRQWATLKIFGPFIVLQDCDDELDQHLYLNNALPKCRAQLALASSIAMRLVPESSPFRLVLPGLLTKAQQAHLQGYRQDVIADKAIPEAGRTPVRFIVMRPRL